MRTWFLLVPLLMVACGDSDDKAASTDTAVTTDADGDDGSDNDEASDSDADGDADTDDGADADVDADADADGGDVDTDADADGGDDTAIHDTAATDGDAGTDIDGAGPDGDLDDPPGPDGTDPDDGADGDGDVDADADADGGDDADDTGSTGTADGDEDTTEAVDEGSDSDVDVDADADAPIDATDPEAPDDDGDTGEEMMMTVESEKASCKAPESEGGDSPEYVKNRGMLCVITAEVNWKIRKGLITGGASAETLRDCIAAALDDIDDGTGSKCLDSRGFTHNETCWNALAAEEKNCGGPEVVISDSISSSDTTPIDDVDSTDGEPTPFDE